MILATITLFISHLIESNQLIRRERIFSDSILSSAGANIIVLNANLQIIKVNQTFEQEIGFQYSEIENQSIFDAPFIADCLESRQVFRKHLGDIDERLRFEAPVQTAESKMRLLDWTFSAVRDDTERMKWLIGTGIDITDRKQAEQELATQKDRLATTLQSIADAVITTDADGNIYLFNPVAETLTGWRALDAIGTHIDDVFRIYDNRTQRPSRLSLKTMLAADSSLPADGSMLLRPKSGSELLIECSSAAIRSDDEERMGMILVFRDITEKEKMKVELEKANKLESLGMLAGGIAHDFNNILMALLGNISIAKTLVQSKTELMEVLVEAESASFRAKDLTHQLLTFAKGGIPVKKPAAIRGLLQEIATFTLRGSNVTCKFKVPVRLWDAEVDEGQISQVFSNLIINADHAMPAGGKLVISGSNVELLPGEIPSLREGAYIKLTFTDNGTGIAAEHLDKIFDPYFTTKQSGSGLGLATSYSIVRKHDGLIQIESNLGAGTTCRIYLPAKKQITRPEKSEEFSLDGAGRILLMDDDTKAGTAIMKMLQMLGYSVVYAQDGNEALSLYCQARERHSEFDAVMLDLTVPGGMGGKETIIKLREIDASVKAVVASGYFNDPILADYQAYGFDGAVVKPFKISQLSTVLKSVLGSEPA